MWNEDAKGSYTVVEKRRRVLSLLGRFLDY